MEAMKTKFGFSIKVNDSDEIVSMASLVMIVGLVIFLI